MYYIYYPVWMDIFNIICSGGFRISKIDFSSKEDRDTYRHSTSHIMAHAVKQLFPEAKFVHGDILHYPQLLKVMQSGFDAVFLFAAFKAAGESMFFPEKSFRISLA